MSRSLIGHIFEIWVSKKTDKPIKPKKPEKKLTEKTESRKKTDQMTTLCVFDLTI